MLPEVQIVKHDLAAGCSPPSRDIGLRLGHLRNAGPL